MITTSSAGVTLEEQASYKSPHSSPEQRTADLLSRMTLEEKAAQMMCVWQQKADTLLDAHGNFDLEKARRAFKEGHGIGQIGRPSDAGSTPTTPEKGKDARGQAELTNAIQKFFIENSRLGIPVVFHEEVRCLEGVVRPFRHVIRRTDTREVKTWVAVRLTRI